MIKGVLTFVAVLAVLIVADVYVAYGSLEPCKVLAIEQARRAGTPDQVDPNSTAKLGTTECVMGLVDSWVERLKGFFS